MGNYKKSIVSLLSRLGLVLLMYQLCRILFYFFNKSQFLNVGIMEFIGGIRFDLSAIFYTNALFIIAHTLPGNFKYKKNYQKILKISFFTVNALFLMTNIIDVEYFKFTSRRSTFSMITASGMKGDMMRLAPVFLKNYWYLVLGFIFFLFAFWKMIPNLKFKHQENLEFKNWKTYSIFVLSIGLILLIGRGGFQAKPLKIAHAIDYTMMAENTSVVLNTPFSILKTTSTKKNLQEKNYFSEAEVDRIYHPVIQLQNEGGMNKRNVVLLILESFGEENWFQEFEGRKLTPFLDSLAQNSLYFTNAYANGRRSIDAVPSTLTTIPYLMEVSYISSPYSFNEIDGFCKILKKEGYNSAFFHGAFTGSQNFYQFSQVVKFDKYYGKEDYDRPEKNDYDGVWGIFDEEFLQFTNRKISTFKQPFFATIFTISSHNPYTIPKKYKGKFPKGNRMIHESISYADYSLKKFFESIQKEDWYKNTVFVITPDHTSGDDKTDPHYNNAVGNYKAPILIFDPQNPKINGKNDKLLQQIDLLGETLDYLNYNGKIFSFGNAPSKTKNRIIANYNMGLYHFIIDNYYVCFDGRNIIKVYDIKKDKLLKNELKNYPKEQLDSLIKAYIQQFNNRVIQNNTTLASIEESANHTK